VLRSFRLTNHRSFRREHELLLTPSYSNDREVVPVAAVLGANASGKSNLLDGLRLMSTLVRGWGDREPGSGIPRAPFRLEPASLLEPTSFAVKLVLNGVLYNYGCVVHDDRVGSEWLHSYPHGRRRVLFEREGASIDFGATVTQRTRAEVIEDLLTDDALFLSVAARLKLDQYQPVADWFRRSLVFVRPGRMGIAMMSGGERLARFIERSSAARTEFLNLARAADVGISDVAAEYIEDPRASEQAVMLVEETAELQRELARSEPSEQEDLKQRLAQAQSRAILLRERSRRVKLLLRHSNTWFELGDESEGTRLWLYCLPDVITGLEVGRTLVIDEIDSSLHPLLVRKLVELFRNPDLNVGGAQLVFTTHDPFLLAPVAGEPGVERDQVWFVEKQPDGTSELYPLTDFKPRNEHNLARRYLGGAYGAIPILDGFELLRAPVTAE